MEFAPTVAMGLLIVAIINFLKFLRAKDWNGVFTQLSVWVAGVVVISLGAHTDFAPSIKVGDQSLATLNAFSLLLVGLTIASIGSFAVEIKKALDGSDSAAKPPLFPSN